MDGGGPTVAANTRKKENMDNTIQDTWNIGTFSFFLETIQRDPKNTQCSSQVNSPDITSALLP